MRRNKAQLTIFAILAILILLSASVMFILTKEDTEVKTQRELSESNSLSSEPIIYFLDSCFEKLAEEGIEYIGERGGYFLLPQLKYDNGVLGVPYFFYEYASILPSITTIENSLSEYLNSYAYYCFGEAKNLTYPVNISFNIDNINTHISENEIRVVLEIPTMILIDKNTLQKNQYSVEIRNSSLFRMYNLSVYLTNRQMEDWYSFCLSCIINEGTKNDFYIDIESIDDYVYLFTIQENTTPNKKFKRFRYANKYLPYSCTNLPITTEPSFLIEYTNNCLNEEIKSKNYTFQIEEEVNLTIRVGEAFERKILASGLNLTFWDNSPLFDIDEKTGLISFTPTFGEVGEYEFLIIVKDGFNSKKYSNIYLKIEDVGEQNEHQ